MDRDLTFEELNEQPEGAIVSMGCPVCEGFEKHKKVNGIWKCQHCDSLCEHGNYHCQTCEIRLLNNVIEELKQENENLKNKLKHFMQDAENKQKIIYKLQRQFL